MKKKIKNTKEKLKSKASKVSKASKQSKVKKSKPFKPSKQNEAETILILYKDLCLTKIEEREGYQCSIKDAHDRVSKLEKIKDILKLLSEVDRVISEQMLPECFPYSQAFFHLKTMLMDKVEQIEEIKKNEESA